MELQHLQHMSCPYPVDQGSEEKYEGGVTELSFKFIHVRSCQSQLPDCSENIERGTENELSMVLHHCMSRNGKLLSSRKPFYVTSK